LALESLRKGGKSTVYNLGNGTGFSVKEVIEAARRVTGHKIPEVIIPRRAGDPAVLVASSKKIKGELNWKPRQDDLATIIASAWEWHRKHPEGYKG
jgi:UDP-glucose 4-epimerase